MLAAGANPMALKIGIDKATACVVEALKSFAKPISSKLEIEQIATISANSDASIGKQIADAMDIVGNDGVITVEEAQGMVSELVVVEGMQFDRGYLSPYFVTDSEKSEAVLHDPKILVFDKKITNMKNIIPVLELVSQANRSLLIIAEDVESEALSTLVVNKLRGSLRVVAVKAPAFGDRRTAMLEDIAILSGCSVVSDTTGLTLDSVELDQLGSCKKVVVTKDSTLIIDGAGDKDTISDRVKVIKAQMQSSTSDFDKEKMQERIAKLSGGIAILKIGATTEVEMREIKDRVDDALSATRAAVKEGIVIGGGCALLHAQKHLEKLELSDHADELIGARIIMKAIEAPYRTICINAGIEPSVYIKMIQDAEDNIGLDAKNYTLGNMIEMGIIDPVKVTRCALQNAASIAGLLLTTESVISINPEDKKEERANPTGPMPAMM